LLKLYDKTNATLAKALYIMLSYSYRFIQQAKCIMHNTVCGRLFAANPPIWRMFHKYYKSITIFSIVLTWYVPTDKMMMYKEKGVFSHAFTLLRLPTHNKPSSLRA